MTSNAPHWLVLTLLAIAVGAYLACGLTVLVAHARHRLATRPARLSTRRPAALTSPRQPAPARIEVTS